MSDLSDFLLARIAEDEERAQCIVIEDGADIPIYWEGRMLFRSGSLEATEEQWREFMTSAGAVRVDDPRLLAECEAKRRIVEMAEAVASCTTHDEARDQSCDECRACEIVSGYDQTILELLALPFADHPDYREEWRA